MDGLVRRLARIGTTRAAARRERLADELRQGLPDDVTVTVEDDRIVVTMRRAGLRWLRDPAFAMLRHLAGWLR